MSEEILEAILEAERLAEIEAERVEAERIESERLLEVARIQDIKERYKNLKDHRAVGAALGISNIDLHVKKICEDPDKVKAEADISELESIDSEEDVKASFVPYQEQRKNEYRSIEEVLHVILDHGLYSEEFFALQTERTQIKIKYPKE